MPQPVTLSDAQRRHLQRITEAGGAVTVLSSGPLTWGSNAWSRSTLNKLGKMGLVALTPGGHGAPPTATITKAGREALAASDPSRSA